MHTPDADRKQAAPDAQGRLRRGRRACVGLLVLLALAAVGWVMRSLDSPYARAQAAWAARPFSAYRASIVHHYELGEFLRTRRDCEMTVEVRSGAEPVLLAGDCAAPLSIEALLARFEPYANGFVAARYCELGDCTCAVSVLTVERDPGTGYPRRIARDWRDATIGAWPVWRLLLPAPARLRATLRDVAERWNPCSPGGGDYMPEPSPIYREEFRIVSLEPL